MGWEKRNYENHVLMVFESNFAGTYLPPVDKIQQTAWRANHKVCPLLYLS